MLGNVATFVIFFIIACSPCFVTSHTSAYERQSNLSLSPFTTRIVRNYDAEIPPSRHDGSPTVVLLSAEVHELHGLTDSEMQYWGTILLTTNWTDGRLRFANAMLSYNRVVLQNDMQHAIWRPDIYFANAHEYRKHDSVMIVYDNGLVSMSTRSTLNLGCPMMLQKYPFDTQVCRIQIESYSYSTQGLRFKWRNTDPVIFNTDHHMQNFHIDRLTVADCTNSRTAATAACVEVQVILKRSYGYYLLTVYLPSIFIVSISWIGFWLEAEALPVRLTLGYILTLTIISETVYVGLRTPQVPYIKAIDVWFLVTTAFVFVAVAEFLVVNYVYRVDVEERLDKERKFFQKLGQGSVTAQTTAMLQIASYLSELDGDRISMKRSSIIDWFSRIAFPVAFGTFCIMYWFMSVQWQPVVNSN